MKHDHSKEKDQGSKSEEKIMSETKSLPLQEYEALLAKIAELEGLKGKLVQSAADFENAKKRLVREKEEFSKFAQERLLGDLLPVIDNLERALVHSKEDESTLKQIVQGVERVSKQLLDTLRKQGLERFTSVGQAFDPHRHEILATLEEPGEDHQIIDEIEPGYLLHGRVLRAAKVRVRIQPSEPDASAAAEPPHS